MSHRIGSRLALAVLAGLVIALMAAPQAMGDPHWLDEGIGGATAEQGQGWQVRSPDAADADRGISPGAVAAPVDSSGGGSDWAYLAIGGGVALVLVAGGAVTVVRRRQRAHRPAVA